MEEFFKNEEYPEHQYKQVVMYVSDNDNESKEEDPPEQGMRKYIIQLYLEFEEK